MKNFFFYIFFFALLVSFHHFLNSYLEKYESGNFNANETKIQCDDFSDVSAIKEVSAIVFSCTFKKLPFLSITQDVFFQLSNYIICPLKYLLNNSYSFQQNFLSHHFLLI